MLSFIIILFIIGYILIALEHPLKIDKTAIALVLGMLLWVVYAMSGADFVPTVSPDKFAVYLSDHPELQGQSLSRQSLGYIIDVDIVEHLGDIMQTVLFLLGAMTIVELVDIHDGFSVITESIHTRSKKRLLWTISIMTFVMSAVLDNLTTTIVMLTLLRKFVSDKKERWLFAGCVVIAANSGGAWSPIGDVTTIMIWAKGNVTALTLIKFVLLPAIVSMLLPLAVVSGKIKGVLPPPETAAPLKEGVTPYERSLIFYLGVGGLLFVPVFKSITHLPPFIGILLVLGVLWVLTEILYKGRWKSGRHYRIPQVISRVDMPSILFFLGILMAVAVLQATGALATMSNFLDSKIHNVYAIDLTLGALSAIVDNVPIVAAALGMYPTPDPSVVGYAANFVVDGHFWGLLSYCAGVGGSIFIIGSAAGVIAMGIEKINFGWYLKNFSLIALLGYLAGALIYILEHQIFG